MKQRVWLTRNGQHQTSDLLLKKRSTGRVSRTSDHQPDQKKDMGMETCRGIALPSLQRCTCLWAGKCLQHLRAAASGGKFLPCGSLRCCLPALLHYCCFCCLSAALAGGYPSTMHGHYFLCRVAELGETRSYSQCLIFTAVGCKLINSPI